MRWARGVVVVSLLSIPGIIIPFSVHAVQPFYDRTHSSRVFGETRNYRIILPPDYEMSRKSYPVIYYFHGHSDRYTVEKYDNGTDTIPKMIAFVAKNDVIVVCVDGYVARDYAGFYGGSPWDIMRNGGDLDFGPYFVELVEHIDHTYRTFTDRRHRATSGLSMGGFMSLYLSARYPQLVGSASSFNPGPEFFTGEKGRRVLWRPKDHVSSHEHTKVRLIRASGDYISQYHEETREAYARDLSVDFEYRQDEYHRHWATSIAETFDFHVRAFADAKLSNIPTSWNYVSAHESSFVWGYDVTAKGSEPGFTYLDDVSQDGLRVTTRRWAPDGPPIVGRQITITTSPLYSPGKNYLVVDHLLKDASTQKTQVVADSSGRLTIAMDGSGHQLSFAGPGTGAQAPVLLPLTSADRLRLEPNTPQGLPIRIYNPRNESMKDLKVELTSAYPTVTIIRGVAEIIQLEPSMTADLSAKLQIRCVGGSGYFEPVRLQLKITYDGWHTTSEDIDALVIPEIIATPAAVEILDGRTKTFPVFHQRGNQGGGDTVERTVTEGKGNGNGILEPGEEATVWIKMVQGMDPFDKNHWYRCKIYSDSPWLTEIEDMEEDKQREWTGAQERTSLMRLSAKAPPGSIVQILLDNETWTFRYTPDVRYGTETLYQAFQLHSHHLHRYQWNVH